MSYRTDLHLAILLFQLIELTLGELQTVLQVLDPRLTIILLVESTSIWIKHLKPFSFARRTASIRQGMDNKVSKVFHRDAGPC
jgi:hypothetical protein